MLKNKEIAKMLNISPAAVSLALNNKKGVSEEMREKVLAIRNGSMEESLSKANKKSMNRKIMFCVLKKHGDIIADIPFFSKLTETLSIEATQLGYELIISHFMPNMDMKTFVSNIDPHEIDGILILGTEASEKDIEMFKGLNIPLVMADSWFYGIDVDAVHMDNIGGMVQAVEYAAACGHKNIGYINSSIEINNFTERFMGYMLGIKRVGLKYDKKVTFHIRPRSDMAYDDMQEILQKKPKLPSILITGNDEMAIGVMRALKDNGYSIPDDISVIGFDDMTYSHKIVPPLTSLHIHHRHIAELAVKMLSDKINGGNGRPGAVHTTVGVDLIKRDSVKILK